MSIYTASETSLDSGLRRSVDGRRRSGRQPRLIGRPGGAITRLVEESKAPVIGIAGSGNRTLVRDILATLLSSQGSKVAIGLREGLAMADSLAPNDHILLDLPMPLIEYVPHGLDLLVLCGMDRDEIADGMPLDQGMEMIRMAISKTAGALVVNADDVQALALAAHASTDVFRASEQSQTSDARLTGDELTVLDPYLAVQRRVCRLEDIGLGHPAYRQSLLLASMAAAAVGIEIDAMRQAILEFKLGNGRLQSLGQRMDLEWINDASSVRPALATRSIQSQTIAKEMLVISGGRHQGAELEAWARACATNKYTIVFGSASENLVSALQKEELGSRIVRCADLEDAISSAAFLASAGDTVLFSPACEPDMLAGLSPNDSFRRGVLGLPVGRQSQAAA